MTTLRAHGAGENAAGTTPRQARPSRTSPAMGTTRTPAVGPGREPFTIAGAFPAGRETFAPAPDTDHRDTHTGTAGSDVGTGSGFDPGGREGASLPDARRRRGRQGGHAIDTIQRPDQAMQTGTPSRLQTAPTPAARPRQGAPATGLVTATPAPTGATADDAGMRMTTGGNRREKRRAADAPTSTARSRSRICAWVSRPR